MLVTFLIATTWQDKLQGVCAHGSGAQSSVVEDTTHKKQVDLKVNPGFCNVNCDHALILSLVLKCGVL